MNSCKHITFETMTEPELWKLQQQSKWIEFVNTYKLWNRNYFTILHQLVKWSKDTYITYNSFIFNIINGQITNSIWTEQLTLINIDLFICDHANRLSMFLFFLSLNYINLEIEITLWSQQLSEIYWECV